MSQQVSLEKLKEIEALKNRVKEGNRKLNLAWEAICQLDHQSARWQEEVEKWHEANEKLSALCSELKYKGFTDCLYLIIYEGLSEEEEREVMEKVAKGIYQDLGKRAKTQRCLEGLGCRVCPSQTSYWEKELMDLPSGK